MYTSLTDFRYTGGQNPDSDDERRFYPSKIHTGEGIPLHLVPFAALRILVAGSEWLGTWQPHGWRWIQTHIHHIHGRALGQLFWSGRKSKLNHALAVYNW